MKTKDGLPTGAIRGILKMFSNLYMSIKFDYIACIFDSPGKNFRHVMYPLYKANRSAMPEELSSQVKIVHEIVDLIGWNRIIVPDVEADDVIGTIATEASKQNIHSRIYTMDKDACQLVNDHITIVNPSTHNLLDHRGVIDKFGVRPDQIIDYLTILGDTSDNVPGVYKAGKKTASEWLGKYNTIEGIVENSSNISGIAIENLLNTMDQVSLSRRLVTIKADCDLSNHIEGWPSLESLKPKELRKKEIRDIKDRCEIRS